MKKQTKQKPALPTIPERKHLLTVANELYLSNQTQAQIAKDMLTRITFTYVQSPVSDKEEIELLYLLWILLDNIQDEL